MLCFVKECFHRNHKLYKICNRNTLKMSYRTTNNMSTFVSKHNRRILKQYHDQQQAVDPKLQIHCNCDDKPQCWLPDRCTITNLVYRATITRLDTNEVKTQTGATVEFKQRQGSYKTSFEDPNIHQTCLSQYIWKNLRRNQPHIPFRLDWSVVDRGPPFNPATGQCKLCLKEKYHIMFNPDGATLNQRTEIFSYCFHQRPQLLKNFNFNPQKYYRKKNKYFPYTFNY